jgi:cellulose 1,4-beta-cellobiosidase
MELTVNNDWGMGYCHTYQLKNTTSAPVTWRIPLEVRGMMNNHWECKTTGDSGMVVFTGEDHNKTIEPNGTAQFGFCAVVK